MLNNLDLKKEEINFKDSGCRFSSSCLNCPIEICIYDDPAIVRNLEKSIRDKNIIKDRAEGLSNKQIAEKYNISVRTVHRSFKTIKPKVNLNLDIKDKILIEKTLSTKENSAISIDVAKKGTKAKVVALAEKNAKESLNRKLYETNNNKNLFEGVSKKFDLKNNINIVEIYDNSHIQGTNSVGAMVTYGDEGFIKKRYRKFDIKTKGAEQDDFAMLKEVLTRRFKRAILEKGNYISLPDLILIDGGKGQYSSAKEVLNELGLYDLPIIAIAKGKQRNSGDETFFYNNKPFKFDKNDPTLFFLQRLRDEAHRFAINAHRAKRTSGLKKSLLDQIEGIGLIRKRALLNHFGSARAVESASFDEIKTVEGVEEKVAKKIYNFFHE